MLLALPFPNFDPVLIQLGPFAIRWYALAYIVGILIGWLYARALVRNERLWGGPAPMTVSDIDDFIVWATLFPSGGPLPRHPSQLYEAALEGLLLFAVLGLLVRAGALKRPGLIIGCFAIGYSLARSFCELFREPDAQLGFLWNTVTMGTLLSVPLLVFGIVMIVTALRRRPVNAAPTAR